MALAYAAAAVFMLPSREDNLPNTMIELLSCGTPIIGFSIGGIKETIQNEFNGYLCSELSVNTLSKTIDTFFKNTYSLNANLISEDAPSKFDSMKQVAKYIGIYKNILYT